MLTSHGVSKNSEGDISIPHFFKTELLDVLSQRGKELNVKFEVMTRQTLGEALNSGCRILCLGSENVSKEGLVVEDSNCRPALISYEELKQLFHDGYARRHKLESDDFASSDKRLELVILASRNDSKFAKWLVEEAHVPHVIYFEFKDVEGGSTASKDKSNIFKRKLYEHTYQNKFVQLFLNELIFEKTVAQSYQNAIRDTIDVLSYSFFGIEGENEITDYLGNGAILLPESDSHAVSFYGSGEFQLQSGKIEDLSFQRFPTNIHKTITPFFGRANDFSQIIQILLDESVCNKGFLHVSGEEGVGKTRLLLEIGWHLVQRHIFPNGVFYLPLRKISKVNMYQLIGRISQSLGKNSDRNHANFFRDKKMLLILDDFDVFYSNDVEFPSLILKMIKKYKIPTIITTTEFQMRETIDIEAQTMMKQFLESKSKIESEYVARTYSLKRLAQDHIANMVVSLTSTSYEKGISHQEALANPTMAKIRGVPARVIELLQTKKISHQGSALEILPYYTLFLDFQKRYYHYFKTGNDLPEIERKMFALLISRHSHLFKEEAEKMNNMAPLVRPTKPKASVTFPTSEHQEEEAKSKKKSSRVKSFAKVPTHRVEEQKLESSEKNTEAENVLPVIQSQDSKERIEEKSESPPDAKNKKKNKHIKAFAKVPTHRVEEDHSESNLEIVNPMPVIQSQDSKEEKGDFAPATGENL